MSLQDFFTLNELQNGLTTPGRVNELITVIQSEKDLVVNSFGQTTRQWSTVATIIAATENKSCLDLFIQLNGLFFIDKWLKDVQKLEKDDQNGSLEEFIVSLFGALEKLQIDDERLLSSGIIMKTVQDLVANNNHTVSEKAKELCDGWMLIQEKNKIPQDAKNSDALESRPLDNIMDSESKSPRPLDCVNPSSKSTDEDENGDSNSISEGFGKSDVKNENEINFRSKTDLVEIALSADVGNPLESCVKTNMLSDTHDDVADDGEILKTSSNSDGDNEANNTIVGAQSNGNLENGSCFLKVPVNNKKSDMELDYGMIVPLDIARQVAIEAEREGDSQERSCSTSEKTPGGIKRPNTPDSKSGQESQSQSQHVGGSDNKTSPGPVKDAETRVSQISEVAHESEPDTRRPFSGFDLNQEVCSEEVGNLNNLVCSSISVVSISRAAAADHGPAAPLEFEGPGTHNSPNQRLEFDLNVAEDGQEDKMVVTPGLPSGEESSVANPGKPERLQWDLNSIEDDQTGWQSPYHASSSSSSSSRQPILRNIDLNLSDQQPTGEEPSISIFGARVEVKRNVHKPQLEPKFDFSYGHHNGMFFSMHVYGSSSQGMPMHTPMPYMVDSRGPWLQPQIMGSQSPSPLPFLMNMAAAGAPSGASGLGPPPSPPQHNFYLNTGLVNNGGFREFFPQNVDEQASSSSVLGKRSKPDSSWQFFPVNKRQQPQWR